MKAKNKFGKVIYVFVVACLFGLAHTTDAAVLKLSPNTGVYSAGSTFTVLVSLNTEGKPVNAADGLLSFNPRELQVTSVSRAGSIFSLWTEEPSFSNTKGTVQFGGGSPTGYKGAAGSIVSVNFKALGAGTPKVTFTNGSALAADGMGTNVLSAMNGGTYTIAAQGESPAPEYIPPANTPQAPAVTSSTHSDESKWYREKVAQLSWVLPKDVIAVRMLLDTDSGTVPTKVYEEPITEKTLEDVSEGTSYFHIQFKNKEGWGRITHYKLNVDSEAPKNFSISELGDSQNDNPTRTLMLASEDVSPIDTYKIQIDGKDPFEFSDIEQVKQYTLEPLTPGYHTLTIEAFDSAGNSSIASYSLTIRAFEKPVFFEYPTRINTDVIPALKGKTRPKSTVSVMVARASGDGIVNADIGTPESTYTVMSDDNGEFVFIPNEPFEQGVYVIRATAKDEFGSISELSDEVKIIVDVPGYIVIGSMVLSVLSVVVPSVALILVLIFGTWYLWHKLVLWKRKVFKETREAEEQLTREFDILVKNLNERVLELKESRKNKLTKAESDLITQIENDLANAREKIGKEISDIEDVMH
jgi:hypothetical protein